MGYKLRNKRGDLKPNWGYKLHSGCLSAQDTSTKHARGIQGKLVNRLRCISDELAQKKPLFLLVRYSLKWPLLIVLKALCLLYMHHFTYSIISLGAAEG